MSQAGQTQAYQQAYALPEAKKGLGEAILAVKTAQQQDATNQHTHGRTECNAVDGHALHQQDTQADIQEKGDERNPEGPAGAVGRVESFDQDDL